MRRGSARRHSLSVRTPPFQGGETGSTPVGATNQNPATAGFFCWPSNAGCHSVAMRRKKLMISVVSAQSTHDPSQRQVDRQRAAYKKGVQHVVNAHAKIGAFTIAQVIDDQERRDSAQVAGRQEAARLARERAALANGPRTVAAACTAFGDRLRGVGGIGDIVDSYSCRGEDRSIFDVEVTVRDKAWTAFTYDERLRLAQSLWQGAVAAARLNEKPDSAHIKLVGQAGESLGGSSWLAGSMIDVNKD